VVDETPGLYRRLGDAALFNAGLRGPRANVPLSADALRSVIATLPVALRGDAGPDDDQSLMETFTHEPRHRVFSELGPVWFRMAARQVDVPVLRAPLVNVADNFDDVAAFLRYLRRDFSLHRSSVLVG